jgi:hypothetical protein
MPFILEMCRMDLMQAADQKARPGGKWHPRRFKLCVDPGRGRDWLLLQSAIPLSLGSPDGKLAVRPLTQRTFPHLITMCTSFYWDVYH